jgi:hypothetical protein
MNSIGRRRHRRMFLYLPLILMLGATPVDAADGAFDLGIGFGGVGQVGSDALEIGWDLQFGYEWIAARSWHIGSQLHLFLGGTSENEIDTDTDLAFDSVAINATFRPALPALSWIQLKAGVVYADYRTILKNQSGVGYGAGLGVILYPNSLIRLRLLDYARYEIEGEDFNVISISFSLFSGSSIVP